MVDKEKSSNHHDHGQAEKSIVETLPESDTDVALTKRCRKILLLGIVVLLLLLTVFAVPLTLRGTVFMRMEGIVKSTTKYAQSIFYYYRFFVALSRRPTFDCLIMLTDVNQIYITSLVSFLALTTFPSNCIILRKLFDV